MDMADHFAAECVWCRQCHVTQANAKRERGYRMKMLAEYLENAIKFEQMAAEEKDATPPFPTTSSKASSTRFPRRVSTFDRQALADIKRFVSKVSLPADEEFPPQMDAFWEAAARPALEARASKARSKTGCNNAPTSNCALASTWDSSVKPTCRQRPPSHENARSFFLAPDLVKAAINGRLPHGMGVARLTDLPAEWSRQREMRRSASRPTWRSCFGRRARNRD
jgi:hypothetical protein